MSMRLRLEADGEPPFWFIGDPTKNERTEMSLALDESFQYLRNQQSVQGAEWDSKKHYDRKNQSFSVAATVKYEFASDWARMDFTARLASVNPALQLHKWQGQVWLRIDKPGTTEFREWQLVDAIITLSAWVPRGAVGLNLRYTVTCKGFGTAQSGESELSRLIGYALPPLLLDIPEADMQAMADLVMNVDTIDFRLFLEVELIGGSVAVLGKSFLPPGATPVPGVSFPLPFNTTSLADYAASVASTFTSLSISAADGFLSFIDTAPLTTRAITVTLQHRFTAGSGGSTITDTLATWRGAGRVSLLTGTLGGIDYVLTGTNQTINL